MTKGPEQHGRRRGSRASGSGSAAERVDHHDLEPSSSRHDILAAIARLCAGQGYRQPAVKDAWLALAQHEMSNVPSDEKALERAERAVARALLVADALGDGAGMAQAFSRFVLIERARGSDSKTPIYRSRIDELSAAHDPALSKMDYRNALALLTHPSEHRDELLRDAWLKLGVLELREASRVAEKPEPALQRAEEALRRALAMSKALSDEAGATRCERQLRLVSSMSEALLRSDKTNVQGRLPMKEKSNLNDTASRRRRSAGNE